jgi:hypothetical protein
MRIFAEHQRLLSFHDGRRRIRVLDDNDLGVGRHSFQVAVELLLEVSAPQVVVRTVRFAVGQQWGVKNNEARMRRVAVSAECQQA